MGHSGHRIKFMRSRSIVNASWLLCVASVVISAGSMAKVFDDGSPIFLVLYTYSDIPTALLHSLWFLRNIGKNLKSLFALFSKASVKESEFMYGSQDFDAEIDANNNMLGKIEKVLFAGFSASFFYVRCVLFTNVLPRWAWNSWRSPRYSKTIKYGALAVVSTILGMGYWWSYKLALKIWEVLQHGGEEAVEAVDEQDQREFAPHMLSSVDEQRAQE